MRLLSHKVKKLHEGVPCLNHWVGITFIQLKPQHPSCNFFTSCDSKRIIILTQPKVRHFVLFEYIDMIFGVNIALVILYKPEVKVSDYHFPFVRETTQKVKNFNTALHKNYAWVKLGLGGFFIYNRYTTYTQNLRTYVLFVNISSIFDPTVPD